MKLSDDVIAALRPMCGGGTGYLIGSLVFGGYSRSGSDVDLLTYEDRDRVEYSEDTEFTARGLGKPLALGICRRPLAEWSDPLAVLRVRDGGLITWKEFSSVEDAIMALSHGVRIAGPPMAVRPTVSAAAFNRYLALRASVLDELSSRGAEWLQETPDEPSPNRFYSKAVTRVAREHAYVTTELTPGRIDQLPDAVDACGAPAYVGAIVGRAVSSLIGVPNARMLSRDEAQEYLAWVNRFEARHGRDEWARLIWAPATMRRPIVDLRKHMDGQFGEGNDRV